MKKASRIIMVVCMLSMFLCSCSDVVNEEREIEYSSMYNEINVMYWYYTSGRGGGLTPMLNADGTPKLYDETTSQYSVRKMGGICFVDTETNVMYWYYTSGYGGGLTPMLNADGTPKLYDETTSQYSVRKMGGICFVDTETNVIYWYYRSGYGGGLTPILKENGPKLAQ